MIRPLNVVHFSTADNLGGSGRSAYRIHTGLRQLGHNSCMLVGQKSASDQNIETVYENSFGRLKNRIADEMANRIGLPYFYFPSSKHVLHHPWVQQADIFQIYNTHGGYFSHRIFPDLSHHAPIVWRLSDMWAMTGHCAYSGECNRWRTGCGECPDLGTYPPLNLDTTAYLWKVKDRIYQRSNITIVAPSSWTEKLARESPLLNRFQIQRIPNGLDVNIYRPLNRRLARELFDIDPNSKVILFCADVLDNNPRKGSNYVIEVLQRLDNLPNTMLMLIGHGGEKWQEKMSMPVKILGYVRDDILMAAAYSCADIAVAPSVLENLPNTVLEAMGCGTPVVAFNTGGMADAVKHMDTGYIARDQDVEDFSRGIRLLLSDETLHQNMAINGRDLIEKEFNAEVQAHRFENLYANILQSEDALCG